MALSLTILTPGSYPIPSSITSSVESSIIQTIPNLSSKMAITILGKKFPGVPYLIRKEGVRYVNFDARDKQAYLQRAIKYVKRNPPTIIQVENRPQYIEEIKKHMPEAKIWLFLHSITFLQAKLIKREKLIQILRTTDRIVVNSYFLKNYLLHIDKLLKHKIIVNYLGVDINQFSYRLEKKVIEQRKKELCISGLTNKKIILFVGRLVPSKGAHHLIHALSIVQKEVKNVVLIIVGGNDYGRNKKTEYVRHLFTLAQKISKRISFVPYTSFKKINRWYRIADVLVTPSVGQEAFGLVNLEAMSTGIPVIASNIGGIPEIIKHGKNGLLVPISNHVQAIAKALVQVLNNEEWAKQLGKSGRTMVERNFTWEHSANRIYPYYVKG